MTVFHHTNFRPFAGPALLLLTRPVLTTLLSFHAGALAGLEVWAKLMYVCLSQMQMNKALVTLPIINKLHCH